MLSSEIVSRYWNWFLQGSEYLYAKSSSPTPERTDGLRVDLWDQDSLLSDTGVVCLSRGGGLMPADCPCAVELV